MKMEPILIEEVSIDFSLDRKLATAVVVIAVQLVWSQRLLDNTCLTEVLHYHSYINRLQGRVIGQACSSTAALYPKHQVSMTN